MPEGQTFDDFQYNPYQSQYVAAPIDELAVLGKTLDDKYNTNKALYDENNLIHVNALDKDIPNRNSTLQGYTDQMAQTVKDNNGAYEKIGPQISMITNRIHKDMTMGKLNAMENNYKSYGDYQKKITDEMAAQKYSPEIGNKLLLEAKNNYQGVGDGGQNGVYNSFQGNQGAKQIDPDLEAEKLYTGFMKQSNEGMSYGQLPDGSMGWVKRKTSEDNPKVLQAYMTDALKNDPELNASINQDIRLNKLGQPSTKLEDYVDPDKANQIRGQYPNIPDSQIIDQLNKNNIINNTVHNTLLKKSGRETSTTYDSSPWWMKQQEWDHEDNKNKNPQTPLINGAPAVKLEPQYKGYTDFKNQIQDKMNNLIKLNDQLNDPNLSPDGKSNLLLQKQLLVTDIQNQNSLKAKIEQKYKDVPSSPLEIANLKEKYSNDYLQNSIANHTLVTADDNNTHNRGVQTIIENPDGTATIKSTGLVTPDKIVNPIIIDGKKYYSTDNEIPIQDHVNNYVNSKMTDFQKKQANTYDQEFQNQNNELGVSKISLPEFSKNETNKTGKSARERITDDIKLNPQAYTITNTDGTPVKQDAAPDYKVTDMYQNAIPGVGRPLLGYYESKGAKDKKTGEQAVTRHTVVINPSAGSNINQLIANDMYTHGDSKYQEMASNLYNEDIGNQVANNTNNNATHFTIPITGLKDDNGKYNVQNIEIHKTSDGAYMWKSPASGQTVESKDKNQLEKDLITFKNYINTPKTVSSK